MPFLLPVHPFASNLYAIRLSSCFTRGSPSIIMVLTRGATRRSAPIAAADEVPERAAKRLKATSSVIERSKKETAIGSSAANDLSVTGKGKNEPRPEDYPERVTSPWKVGVHVSAAGGVENAVQNAAAVGANAFALFLKSQRKWASPPLKAESISTFKLRLEAFGYSPSHVLPHGSYLINLGNPDKEKRDKSYECFLEDLQRCEQLGLELYNFHPGSTVGSATREVSIALIAECLNRAHKATDSVITVIENMAGAGNTIGSTFLDLADIIQQVENKSRVGVCLDTCHMFAAGYDIRTKEGWESTVSAFDAQVGLSYLRAMHLNDSKTSVGSKRDRHENIGIGHISLPTFHNVVTDRRLKNIPLILETPSFESTEVWTKEIDVLNRLSTLDDKNDHTAAIAVMAAEIKQVVKKAGGSITL